MSTPLNPFAAPAAPQPAAPPAPAAAPPWQPPTPAAAPPAASQPTPAPAAPAPAAPPAQPWQPPPAAAAPPWQPPPAPAAQPPAQVAQPPVPAAQAWQPPPPAAAPPAPAAPAAPPVGVAMPGGMPGAAGVAMPGMTQPGARSPGAGAGAVPESFAFKPKVRVEGTYRIRPHKWVNTERMVAPKIIFEVYDEAEITKARANQPNVAGATVEVTLWPGDQRTMDVFAALGYPEGSMQRSPEGYPIFPLKQIFDRKPLVWATITQEERRSKPGQFDDRVTWGQLVQPNTTGAA